MRVISGDSRGKEGRVLRVIVDKQRAVVEGINMMSKHSKPTQQNPNGGIIRQEAPIHVSNLMLLDPKSGKTTRIGRQRDESGRWVRVAKASGQVIK